MEKYSGTQKTSSGIKSLLLATFLGSAFTVYKTFYGTFYGDASESITNFSRSVGVSKVLVKFQLINPFVI